MRKLIIFTVFLSAFALISIGGFTQGCSDAGFCTIGALKPLTFSEEKAENKAKHKISFFYPAWTGRRSSTCLDTGSAVRLLFKKQPQPAGEGNCQLCPWESWNSIRNG